MSTIPSHTGVGISWECASSGHGKCTTSGCRCACHYRLGEASKPLIDRVSREPALVPTPPMDSPVAPINAVNGDARVCPKCGTPAAKPTDKFCRRDGTPFTDLHCGNCGEKALPGDLHCAECGSPMTPQVTVKSASARRKTKTEASQ